MLRAFVRAGRGSAALLASAWGGRVLSAAASLLVIRYLGANVYGELALVLAVAAVGAYVSEAGLNHIFLREASRPGADVRTVAGRSLTIRLVLAAGVCIVTPLCGWWALPRSTMVLLLAVVIPTAIGAACLSVAEAYYQYAGRLGRLAVFHAATPVLIAGGLIAAVASERSVATIGAIYGAAQLATGIVALGFVWAEIRPRLGTGWRRAEFAGAGALFVAGLATVATPHVSAFTVAATLSLGDVGSYAAAARIVAILSLAPTAIGRAMYAPLHAAVHRGWRAYLRQRRRYIVWMTTTGAVVAIPMAVAGPGVARLLFGRDWPAESGYVLRVLSFVVVLQSARVALSQALVVANLNRANAVLAVAGLFILAAFTSAAGLAGGIVAVAGATVAAEIIVVTGLAWLTKCAEDARGTRA